MWNVMSQKNWNCLVVPYYMYLNNLDINFTESVLQVQDTEEPEKKKAIFGNFLTSVLKSDKHVHGFNCCI